MENSNAMLEFECPRCSGAAAESFYGPCGVCRDELRQKFAFGPGAVESKRYEPKMNVQNMPTAQMKVPGPATDL